jgi:hypothetical protein
LCEDKCFCSQAWQGVATLNLRSSACPLIAACYHRINRDLVRGLRLGTGSHVTYLMQAPLSIEAMLWRCMLRMLPRPLDPNHLATEWVRAVGVGFNRYKGTLLGKKQVPLRGFGGVVSRFREPNWQVAPHHLHRSPLLQPHHHFCSRTTTTMQAAQLWSPQIHTSDTPIRTLFSYIRNNRIHIGCPGSVDSCIAIHYYKSSTFPR